MDAQADEMFMSLAGRLGGIEALLRCFFSFLHRKVLLLVANKGCKGGLPCYSLQHSPPSQEVFNHEVLSFKGLLDDLIILQFMETNYLSHANALLHPRLARWPRRTFTWRTLGLSGSKRAWGSQRVQRRASSSSISGASPPRTTPPRCEILETLVEHTRTPQFVVHRALGCQASVSSSTRPQTACQGQRTNVSVCEASIRGTEATKVSATKAAARFEFQWLQ